MIAAHITSDEWPDKPLAITAVEAETGRRIIFTARSGVTLLDALAGSGALPGIFPLVTVNGKRYADGGVHSPYNADLAVGNDVIFIVSPLAANTALDALLESELAALGHSRVHLIRADDASLSAIGPDPLSSETAQAALTAGAKQAAREAERLKNLWPA
jgi:NTE family protein